MQSALWMGRVSKLDHPEQFPPHSKKNSHTKETKEGGGGRRALIACIFEVVYPYVWQTYFRDIYSPITTG